MDDGKYSIEPLPIFRRLLIDSLDVGRKKHWIHGMIEADITDVRERFRQIKEQTGASLSFTGFIIHCCARAIEEDKHVHAYRDWRKRLVLYDEVDVSVPVELPAEGGKELLQLIIRAANRKSVQEIHREIRQAQTKRLGDTPWGKSLRWLVLLPSVFRRILFRVVDRTPRLVKRFTGTVTVTSIGMFGAGAGWGIPLAGHTLCVTVGGLVSRPAIVDGQLREKEYLCLTLTFDHDIIDGAPAARFIQRFKELIESGSGL